MCIEKVARVPRSDAGMRPPEIKDAERMPPSQFVCFVPRSGQLMPSPVPPLSALSANPAGYLLSKRRTSTASQGQQGRTDHDEIVPHLPLLEQVDQLAQVHIRVPQHVVVDHSLQQ